MKSLCIVMPIYNEQDSIEKTFFEWQETLKTQSFFKNYTFLLINDGSTDKTLEIINQLKNHNHNIVIIDKLNTGHGQSCLVGYNYAVVNKYDFILQIDSDGQCNPKYLSKFIIALENNHEIVYGIRYYRKDGLIRFFISRILSLIALYKTKIWSWDPNVPYRIFKTNTILDFLAKEQNNFVLINVLLSLYHKRFGIYLVPIIFRDRHGGSPSIKTGKLYQHGILFYKQLSEIY